MAATTAAPATNAGPLLLARIPVEEITSVGQADKHIEKCSSDKWSNRYSALGKLLVAMLFTAGVLVAAIAVAHLIALILTPISLIPVVGPTTTLVLSLVGAVVFGGVLMQPIWNKLYKPAWENWKQSNHCGEEIVRIEARRAELSAAPAAEAPAK